MHTLLKKQIPLRIEKMKLQLYGWVLKDDHNVASSNEARAFAQLPLQV
jgi:hypothetical protein